MSVIASVDSIWVQNGYDFEDKFFPENSSLLALFIEDEIKDAIQYI